MGDMAKRLDLIPLPPPKEEEEKDDPKGITVRFSPEDHEQLLLIARLWNALDEAMGVKRRHSWKASSVLRHAARFLRDQLKEKMRDWPSEPSQQEAFIERHVAAARRMNEPK